MKRNLKTLQETQFDILIVGGGIYGAAAAWEASRQGLSVALIEKGDFGGATSANSLKTVHGGLRYLQTLDIKRVRESVIERRRFLQIAPHIVRPLPVIMPTYGWMMKSKHAMFAGLLLNDILSADRNISVDASRKIPMGRVLSKHATLRMLPGIALDGVTGAAFWTDAQMYSSERMLLAFVLSAAENGVQAANYVKAEGFLQTDQRIEGVQAKDMLTGESFEIKAKTVLNTNGGWINELLGTLDKTSPVIQLSTAMNIVVNKPILTEYAAGVYGNYKYTLPSGGTNKGRHVLFMSPWRDHTIIGTYHRPYSGNPDDLDIKEEDLNNFLKEVNSAWPNESIRREDISFVQKGFLPMDGIHPKTGEVQLTKHYKLMDHAQSDHIEGLVSLAGVKYTTARDVAAKAVQLVMNKQGKSFVRKNGNLAGGDIPDMAEFEKSVKQSVGKKLNHSVVQHLISQYGKDNQKILSLADENKTWMEPVPESEEVLLAEIIHAVRNEMAQKLSDVILRRTDLGSAEYPGEKAIHACANLMAKELKWTPEKKKQEIQVIESIYQKMQVK